MLHAQTTPDAGLFRVGKNAYAIDCAHVDHCHWRWRLLGSRRAGHRPSLVAGRPLERQGTASVTLEMRMLPAGGMMLGASRTVAGGAVRGTERLALREQGGRLAYIAEPSDQSVTVFTSTQVTDSTFTVENPEHDFPQRIMYRRLGVDSLLARIEGPGPSGPRAVEFPMRKVSCSSRGVLPGRHPVPSLSSRVDPDLTGCHPRCGTAVGSVGVLTVRPKQESPAFRWRETT